MDDKSASVIWGLIGLRRLFGPGGWWIESKPCMAILDWSYVTSSCLGVQQIVS